MTSFSLGVDLSSESECLKGLGSIAVFIDIKIYSWNIKNDREYVYVRRAKPDSLTRNSLILFGLLVGGDYDDQVS